MQVQSYRIDSHIGDIVFRKTLIAGEQRPRGWLTRNMLANGKPRNLLLFSEHNLFLLDSNSLPVFNRVKDLLASTRPQYATATGTVKHLVNEIFGGEDPLLSPEHDVTVGLYKFGPIPVVIFGQVDQYTLGIYPFAGTPD